MKHYIYLFAIAFVLFSCSKDDDNQEQQGSISDIKNWANAEIIDAIEDLGYTIHDGNNPPNIEGKYQISSRILEASSVPGDYPIGTTFFRINMTFDNQDNNTLTVNFTGVELDSNGNAYNTQVVDNFNKNSYITGSGNLFTAFFKVNEDNNGIPAQLLYVFSGEITENGISNIRNALFMLDNYGNSSTYMDNNTGRVFKDSDDMADRIL